MKKSVLPQWSPGWREGGATCPQGCPRQSPQDQQGQKEADPGIYVTGGRGATLFPPQFQCRTSGNFDGGATTSWYPLPVTPRLSLRNMH